MASSSVNAAVCTALGNGNWSNPANWSCGSLPGCGDFIVVPAGMTVTVDIQVDLDENSSPACSTAIFMEVYGTLQFVTGNKISLACGSGVEVMPGGSMLPGGGGGASNWLKICEVTEWQTSHGPVSGYKLFGAPSPLPVEFVSFDVDRSGSNLRFVWVVASERENDFFSIEFSEDGKKWMTILSKNSIGDHVSEMTYIESTEFAISSTSYFRLKQTDKNDETKILDTKSLKVQNELRIYPNPVRSGSTVELSVSEKTETEVMIYNTLGQLVKRDSFNSSEDILIDTEGMKRGVYLVKVPGVDKEKVYRLIVE
jgi:hypothetical protein